MKRAFKYLRTRQLDRELGPYRAAAGASRPAKGWLRAIRQAAGMSSRALAERMGSSRQLIAQQEKAEAEERITLASLRRMADALDCDLVYAVVPRAGSLQSSARKREQAQARANVLRAEHTMALEDQAAGGIAQAVAAELQRTHGKRRPQ